MAVDRNSEASFSVERLCLGSKRGCSHSQKQEEVGEHEEQEEQKELEEQEELSVSPLTSSP